jgi:hypothetical protein
VFLKRASSICLIASASLALGVQAPQPPTPKPPPAVEAGPVYKLLGKDGLDTDVWPAAKEPILHDIGYYMHDGGHGMVPSDWDIYLDFLKMHLHPER